jgi:hypothetical protein
MAIDRPHGFRSGGEEKLYNQRLQVVKNGTIMGVVSLILLGN